MNQLNAWYRAYVKPYVKAVAAWVGGVLTTMVLNLFNGTAVWPHTQSEWTQYLVTSFGAAIAVLIAPTNKITQKQIDKDPNVIGGLVVPDAQIPTAVTPVAGPAKGGEYQNPWNS